MKRLAHIGIAVRDLKESTALYSRLLGVECDGTETVSDQKVKLAFFHLADTSIELTEATADDSPIAKFIQKRGEGVHHLSFAVDDIVAEIARLKAQGFRMIDDAPRTGAGGSLIAFVHPSSTGGVLVELTQYGT